MRTPPRPIEEYAARLRAAGAPVQLHSYETGHLGAGTQIEQAIDHQVPTASVAQRVIRRSERVDAPAVPRTFTSVPTNRCRFRKPARVGRATIVSSLLPWGASRTICDSGPATLARVSALSTRYHGVRPGGMRAARQRSEQRPRAPPGLYWALQRFLLVSAIPCRSSQE